MRAKRPENTTVLKRQQLDRYIDEIRWKLRDIPKTGWIAAIRNALLMTTAQLAKRMGIPQSNVSIFEKAERNKSITLKSLERAADALGCDVHYVFVPRTSLEKTLAERAKKLYQHDELLLENQMRLEGQGTKRDSRRALEQAMLVINRDKRLWEDLD